MRRGQVIALALLGLAIALTSHLLPEWRSDTPVAKPMPVDPDRAVNPLAALQLTTLSGGPVDKSAWVAKVVVANYWATWCTPCRAEMPEFSALHAAYAGRGVQFLGITLDTADNVAGFVKQIPVSYPLLLAPQSAIEATVALGNTPQALPFTVIVDRAGKVAAVRLGRYRQNELEAEIKRLL